MLVLPSHPGKVFQKMAFAEILASPHLGCEANPFPFIREWSHPKTFGIADHLLKAVGSH